MTYRAVESLLEVAAAGGSRDLPSGTRLRYLDREVGPQAWRHAVHPPLVGNQVTALATELRRSVPGPYERFLANYNGMSLYFGDIALLGARSNHRRTVEDVLDQPFSVVDQNTCEKPGWLTATELVIGRYFEEWITCGDQVRWVSENGRRTLGVWDDVETALAFPLEQMFKEVG